MHEDNTPSVNKLSRRTLIAAGAASLAGLAASPATATTPAITRRRRVLRLAHLTDVHVQPEREAGKGFAACLEHVQNQKDAPELLVFGGDNIMDVAGNSRERGNEQLDVWRGVLKNHLSTPSRTVIGNHDVLQLDPVEGKQWACDEFGLDSRYYAFDQAGWRMIVLDSTSPEGGGYKGRLDDEQFDWLASTLRDTPETTPVLVISHIPIFAACAFFDGDNEKSGDWRVPGAWMHLDARKLKNLFKDHANVKLCISGHTHLADTVEYLGVTYCCNGAVSGGWWGGNYQEFGPSYARIDLYDDGSFENELIDFPWTPR